MAEGLALGGADGGQHRWLGGLGRSGGGHGDAAAGLESLGIADAVELQQALAAEVVAVGDFGDGFARLHRVISGAAAGGKASAGWFGGFGRSGGGHGDAAADLEALGVTDAVELQQAIGADAVAVGDFGDGFARFHRVVAPAGPTGGAPPATPMATPTAAWTAGGAWDRQLRPHLEGLGILNAVQLQQPIDADVITIGDVGERFARLHHNLTRQPGQGQQQGQGQGDSRAAHGEAETAG